MASKGNVILGIGLIALGVVISLASEHTIYYGLVFVGVFRIVRGMSAGPAPGPARETMQRPPPDDPRWQPATTERQVVGQPCVECAKRFVTADDAEDCATCGSLVHGRCLAAHGAARHAVAAYR